MTTPRVVGLCACILATVVYLLRLNTVAGLYVDDAWYLMLAQAVASGDGYRLISAPTPELAAIWPATPPGFPLVLALVVAVTPAFPDNVVLLKLVSVAAMLGVGAIAAVYYWDRRTPASLSIGVALVVVLTPAFVWLSTSTVMSEPVFTLAQLATIVLVGRHRPVAAGIAGAAAVLTRSAGLPLLVAGALWYVVSQRRRDALLFLATAVVLLLPWTIYSQVRATPLEHRLAHGGAHVFTYAEQFWMRRAGEQGSGTVTLGDLPKRLGDALVDVFGRDTGAIVLPELYRTPIESGEETLSVGGQRTTTSMGSMGNTTGTMVLSGLLSALALVGFVSRWRQGPEVTEYFVPLALIPILLFPHFAFRLVLPLTPFLYGYLVAGVQALTPAWPRVLKLGLTCILGLHVLDHTFYRVHTDQAVWLEDAREVDTVIEFLQREVVAPGHVASSNPALIYLRTGRRGVAIDEPRARWSTWRAQGVRYLVSFQGGELPDPALPYRVLFKTPRSGYWVLEATD